MLFQFEKQLHVTMENRNFKKVGVGRDEEDREEEIAQ